MKIPSEKLLVFSSLLAVIVILGAILYYLSLTRLNNCEHHAEVNQRFNEMLVLVRVEIPEYLVDNPDTSQKEFAEYCTREQFDALGIAYFKVSVGKGYFTYEDIIYLLSIHIG